MENFSFTFIEAEDFAAEEEWQKKYFKYCTICQCKGGASVVFKVKNSKEICQIF
jgi:hypothetical protein